MLCKHVAIKKKLTYLKIKKKEMSEPGATYRKTNLKQRNELLTIELKFMKKEIESMRKEKTKYEQFVKQVRLVMSLSYIFLLVTMITVYVAGSQANNTTDKMNSVNQEMHQLQEKYDQLNSMFVNLDYDTLFFDTAHVVTDDAEILSGGPIECEYVEGHEFIVQNGRFPEFRSVQRKFCLNSKWSGYDLNVHNVSTPVAEPNFIQCFMLEDGRVLPGTCYIHVQSNPEAVDPVTDSIGDRDVSEFNDMKSLSDYNVQAFITGIQRCPNHLYIIALSTHMIVLSVISILLSFIHIIIRYAPVFLSFVLIFFFFVMIYREGHIGNFCKSSRQWVRGKFRQFIVFMKENADEAYNDDCKPPKPIKEEQEKVVTCSEEPPVNPERTETEPAANE